MSAKKLSFAEQYVQNLAMRNEITRILTDFFGSKEGPGYIAMVADEILAVDPSGALAKLMATRES